MKSGKTRLAIGTGFWRLAALPGGAVAIMTPMMFDAPGSTQNQLLIFTALVNDVARFTRYTHLKRLNI
ncbi:MAG: hypothetical protein WCJ64_24600 [Rhodospirillaceae bacterium]